MSERELGEILMFSASVLGFLIAYVWHKSGKKIPDIF